MLRTTLALGRALFAAIALVTLLPSQSPPSNGLALWLRADRGVTTSGGSVTAWADQSGNGVDLTSGVAGAPTLTPNVVNGLPAVTFSGSEQLNGGFAGPTGAASVFALCRYTNASSNNDYLYSIGRPGSSGSMYSLSRRGGNGAYHYDGARTNIQGTLPHGRFFVATQVYGGGTPQSHQLFEGADTVMQTSAANDYATDGSIRLGNYSSGSYRFVGDVVEFLVYDRALDGEAVLSVWQYLRQRAGLAPFHRPIDGSLTDWSVVQYELNQQPDADWQIAADGQSVYQPVNADASIFLAPDGTQDSSARGRFSSSGGPDFIGFVFGYQDQRQFYLFDWKRVSASYCGASKAAGMRVRIIDMQNGMDPTCAQLWSDTDGVHTTTLRSNTVPWALGTEYEYELTRVAGGFRIRILDGSTVLEDWTITDNRYPSGRFGLYLHSQQQVIFTRPLLGCDDPTGVDYGSACTGVLGLEPTLSSCGGAYPGQSFELTISNCIGGSFAAVLLGLSRTNVPLPNGCRVLVGNPLGTFGPIQVSGTAPANGFATLPLMLPATVPTGVVMDFQALTLDATVANGFLASKGYEVTVR